MNTGYYLVRALAKAGTKEEQEQGNMSVHVPIELLIPISATRSLDYRDRNKDSKPRFEVEIIKSRKIRSYNNNRK